MTASGNRAVRRECVSLTDQTASAEGSPNFIGDKTNARGRHAARPRNSSGLLKYRSRQWYVTHERLAKELRKPWWVGE